MQDEQKLTSKFQTVEEFATEKKITVQAVYKQIKNGKLKSRKLGKLILVDLN